MRTDEQKVNAISQIISEWEFHYGNEDALSLIEIIANVIDDEDQLNTHTQEAHDGHNHTSS
jgi:hypothetical protein